MNVPVVSMPSVHFLKTCSIYGIVLCDETAHLRVAFDCDQFKEHSNYVV